MVGSLLKNYQSFPGIGMNKTIEQYFCSFSFREMVGSFLINRLFKKSSEYFLFFAEWSDNYIGRGGSPSDRCDRLRSAKILSDLVKVLGGSESYF